MLVVVDQYFAIVMVLFFRSSNGFIQPSSHRPYIMPLMWPYKSDISTVFNKNCADLLNALVQCVQLPHDAHNSATLRCLQTLLSLVVRRRCDLITRGRQLPEQSHRSPLRVYSSDRPMLCEVIKRLQMCIVERLTSQQTRVLLQSTCDAWLACVVTKEALDSYDWSLLPLSCCASHDQPLTLHDIVTKFFYLLPPLVSENQQPVEATSSHVTSSPNRKTPDVSVASESDESPCDKVLHTCTSH